MKNNEYQRTKRTVAQNRKAVFSALFVALILFSIAFAPLPAAKAGVVVAGIDLVFEKPNLNSMETVTGNFASVLAPVTLKNSGNITYYRINAEKYPVIAVKQSSFTFFWKNDNSPWTSAEQAEALKGVKSVDGSIDSSSGWYLGSSFNDAQKSNTNYSAGPYGNYFYYDGYFYIQKDKLSHVDWGEDPDYAAKYTGTLVISKELAGNLAGWNISESTEFYAKVKNVDTSLFMSVTGSAPNYTFSSWNATGSVIYFSAAKPAVISMVPYGNSCLVLEDAAGYYTAEVKYPGGGSSALIATGTSLTVTVANDFREYQTGSLKISKKLIDTLGRSPDDPENYITAWDVTSNTLFNVRIWDVTSGARANYLIFEKVSDTEYVCVGNNLTVSADSGRVDSIQIKGDGSAVTVTNLYAYNSLYELEETGVVDCEVSYAYDPLALTSTENVGEISSDGSSVNVTVTNTYDDPATATSYLIVRKLLDGRFFEWDGVDADTEFSAAVKDGASTLWFEKDDTNPYRTIYFRVPSETANSTQEITFSVNKPAYLANMLAGHSYEIIESAGANYSITYSENNKQPFPSAQGRSLAVTVTNTYLPNAATNISDVGNLMISKLLNTAFVPGSTEFTAKVRNSDGDYLKVTGSFPNYKFDETTHYDESSVITFSADQYSVITGIPEGMECTVEEEDGATYNAVYSQSDVVIESGKMSEIVVTNFAPYSPPPPDTTRERERPIPQDDPTEPPVQPSDPIERNLPEVPEVSDDSGGNVVQDVPEVQETTTPEILTPGGNVLDIPPNPTALGNLIVPGEDEFEFIELGDDGVPLGRWYWDEDENMWLFDEYPPLAELPKTGLTPIYPFLLLGCSMLGFGIILTRRTRKDLFE